jgi:isopenicillin-N epimerase
MLQTNARKAAAKYLGGNTEEIALTDSTTMGLGLLYGGLQLRPDEEVLTTANDYYATHEALRAASQRTGTAVREVQLYVHGEPVFEGEFVDRVLRAIGPQTRAVALTWVHSSKFRRQPPPC